MASFSRPHALMLPFPETGHINPLMQLSRYLSSCHGFAITFVNTEYNHRRIVQASAGRLPRGIRLLAIPDGLTDDDNRDSDIPAWVRVIENVGPVLEEIISTINAQGPHPVTCIISDVTAVKTVEVAQRFGIPRVGFWPPNASVHAYICHASSAGLPDFDKIASFPGLPPLQGNKLPWIAGRKEEWEAVFCSVRRNVLALCHSEWVLCNSVLELEPSVQDLLPSGYQKVCPVGPILPREFLERTMSRSTNYVTTSMWVEHDECLAWLDMKEPQSVLYVSVGSFAILNAEKLLELANGLEASGANILWVLRAHHTKHGGLPEGFEERNKEKIRIVDWCPQLLVLSHMAVGAFLTHCGWNSILEAMSVGVPMLTWPQTVDQFVNSELVVGVWGVGMEFGQDVVRKDIVESRVREMMAADGKAEDVRGKAAEKRTVILQASREGGSSCANMLKFVQWMTQQSEASIHGRVP